LVPAQEEEEAVEVVEDEPLKERAGEGGGEYADNGVGKY